MHDDLLVRLQRAGAALDEASATSEEQLPLVTPQRRRSAAPLLLAAASLVVIVGAAAYFDGRAEPSTSTTGPAAATADLGASPSAVPAVPEAARVLPAEPGWTIVSVSELSATEGEVTFTGHGRSATLTWSPADAVPEPSAELEQLDVAGFTASVGSYDDRSHVATWDDGALRVAFLGDGTPTEFRELLAALRQVDDRTWKAALPAGAR